MDQPSWNEVMLDVNFYVLSTSLYKHQDSEKFWGVWSWSDCDTVYVLSVAHQRHGIYMRWSTHLLPV